MTKSQNKPLLWTIFAAYSVLTLLGALNHEVWLDEAQAWVILRDAPLSELPHILKVEGHPPLWYIILYPFVKLGFPTDYVSLIGWFFMAAGALILLFKVELPLPLKAVMLASSGFLYFNSVMLRVYCLIPPLLFLILWVYPKRREHAVIYGLLIALLANTHIFISGIVGMLGIFMLYELFSEWKSVSKKENAGKLIGLAVAGTGVLILVVPLIGSIGANGATVYRLSSFGSAVQRMFSVTFNEVFLYSVCPLNKENILWMIPIMLAKAAFLAMLVLLRHWRKAFAVQISFLAIYYISCGLIWTTLPNRAVIFILSLAFTLCLSKYEKPIFKEYMPGDKVTGKIRSLVQWLIKTDKKSSKIYTWILTVLFAASIPSGVILLLKDIGGNFSGSKEMAEYISENLENDAVIVHLGIGVPELSFYDPEINIFCTDACELTAFARWDYSNHPKETAEECIKALSEYKNLYLVYYYFGEEYEKANTFYTAIGIMNLDAHNSIALCEFDESDIVSYFESIEALYETKNN